MEKYFIFLIAVIFYIRSKGSLSVNIALNKPAIMNSRIPNNWRGYAKFAVDGHIGSSLDNDYCAHSEREVMPSWWMVDLEDTYLVHAVALTNRDMLPERLHYFVIEMFEKNPINCDNIKSSLCHNDTTGTLGISETRNFTCDKPTAGRFLRIKLWNSNVDPITICEAQVFGVLENSCGKPARYHLVEQTRLISGNSVILTTPLMKCPMKCSESITCLAFNFNTQTEQCELIFHPQFGNTTEKISEWNYYGCDLC